MTSAPPEMTMGKKVCQKNSGSMALVYGVVDYGRRNVGTGGKARARRGKGREGLKGRGSNFIRKI